MILKCAVRRGGMTFDEVGTLHILLEVGMHIPHYKKAWDFSPVMMFVDSGIAQKSARVVGHISHSGGVGMHMAHSMTVRMHTTHSKEALNLSSVELQSPISNSKKKEATSNRWYSLTSS